MRNETIPEQIESFNQEMKNAGADFLVYFLSASDARSKFLLHISGIKLMLK
jgi:hypothetical protein